MASPLLLLAGATLADAIWTTLGLSLGLTERGPVASRLLPELGPLYWLFQFTVLTLLYRALTRAGLRSEVAAVTAALGPAVAAASNMLMVLATLIFVL